MHIRLAERRELIQAERWASLVDSIDATSDRVVGILGDAESVPAQRLIARLLILRRFLSEHDYSSTHLGTAVLMVRQVAASLSQLAAEKGLTMKAAEPDLEEGAGPP